MLKMFIVIVSLLSFWGYVNICFNKETNANERNDYKENIAKDTVIFHKGDTTYIIDKKIDLKGHRVIIPSLCKLYFRGGVISNGSLVGNNTVIIGGKKIFDNVKISGAWNVPNISTDMFCQLKDVNSISNVFALANKKIRNRIVIEKGTYRVAPTQKTNYPISIPGHTDVILNGVIKMIPNNRKHYALLNVENASHVKISGSGQLVGDRYKHIGSKGEWGMGIRLIRADKIDISGVKISDAWGDCIYVGRGCKNVFIHNCFLKEGRRQGISIIACTYAHVYDCEIVGINGTPPGYAIDVEPNKDDIAEYALIERVKVNKCRGGILALGSRKNGIVNKVVVRDCSISTSEKFPIYFKRCKNSTAENCIITKGSVETAIKCTLVENLILNNNKVKYRVNPVLLSKCGKVVNNTKYINK